tara:strand:- start:2505 stop:3257 length:753 start_codon:yes stop_codon:yes gene_type:complete
MEKNKLKDVVLVTTDEKAMSLKWEDNAQALKGIQVISDEYDLRDLQSNITFIGVQNSKEQVFVKNPFNELEYIEISRAEDNIFKNKIKYYKRIAFLLGAKSFSAQAEFIEENKFTMDVNGNISHRVVEINMDVKKEQIAKFNKTYNLNSEFTLGDNFDQQRAFNEANELVRKLNFQNEIDIVGLIENNNPSDQSRETKQVVKLQLTNELNDLLEMSFRINVMGGLFSLGANFKSTTESVKKIILNTEIIF